MGDHIGDMTDDDMWPCTEANVKGTFFDVEHMLELKRKSEVGLWVWLEEWQPYQMIMGPAPIAESGREIIEQAKEEAFLAWGL